MKILYLLDEWPIPATSGAKVHDKIMLRCLSDDWQAHIGCWVYRDDVGTTALPAEQLFPRTKLSWRRFPIALFKLMFQDRPLHCSEFMSRQARRKLSDFVESISPDVVILSAPRLAAIVPFLRRISEAKIVVDTHDVHVQRCTSIYNMLPTNEFAERLKQNLLIRSYSIIEKEIYKCVDVAWVLKDEDKELLESFNSVSTVHIVPNVVDPDMVQMIAAEEKRARKKNVSCVFIGDYSYKPNERCALALIDWFSSDRLINTDVSLFLVGVNPTTAMQRRAEHFSNIDVTGRVDDLSDYLYPIDAIFLVPLLAGGGVKRKVIEAMACGCPVITTTVGAEGLSLQDGETAVIRSVEEFPESIAHLVENREMRIRLATDGQRYINTYFGYGIARESVRVSLSQLRS